MSDKQKYHAFGPSGGIGGESFFAAAPVNAFKIVSVWGKSGARINRIGVDWSTPDGIVSSSPFGGNGGTDFRVNIDPGDYLTQIFGSVVMHNDSLRVSSLKFVTKNNKETTVGTLTEYQFSLSSPDGYQIGEIFGRAGAAPGGELDAFGVSIDLIG